MHKKIRNLFSSNQEASCQREMLAAVDSFDFSLLKSPSINIRKLALIYGSVLIRTMLDCPGPKEFFEKNVKGPFIVRGQFIYIAFDSQVDPSLEDLFLNSYQSKRNKMLFYYTVGNTPRRAAIVLGVCEDRVLKNLSSPRFLDCLPDPETTSIFIYFQPGLQYKVYDLNFEWMELESYKQYHLSKVSRQITKSEHFEASLLLTQSKHLHYQKTKNFTVEIPCPKSTDGNLEHLQFNSLPTKIELADEIGSVSTKEDSQPRFDLEIETQVLPQRTSEPTTRINRLFRVSKFNPNVDKEVSYFDRQRDTLIIQSDQPELKLKRKLNFDRQSTSTEQHIRIKTKDFSLRSPTATTKPVKQTTEPAKSVLKISGMSHRDVRKHKSLENKTEKDHGINKRFPYSEQKVTITSLSLINSKPNQRNKTRLGFFLIKSQKTSEDKH